jgi:hypothetical protein
MAQYLLGVNRASLGPERLGDLAVTVNLSMAPADSFNVRYQCRIQDPWFTLSDRAIVVTGTGYSYRFQSYFERLTFGPETLYDLAFHRRAWIPAHFFWVSMINAC